MTFSKLFSPITIKNLTLRNRLMMLPVSSGFQEPDETVGARYIQFYEARAKGGVGLIDIPFAPLREREGGEPGLYDDRFLPGARALTSALHAHGAAVSAQLIVTYEVGFGDGPAEVVGPSPVYNRVMHATPRELTRDEIRFIVAAYGHAARRARAAGFDAVDILIGAGYILNRFLSPIANERQDEYGGSLENRMRMSLEVIEAVRREAGKDFPIFCRLNIDEQMTGGLTPAETAEILKVLEKNGVDLIIVYTGWHESPVPTVAPSLPKGAFAHLARRVKDSVALPVVASNRINDPFTAEKILADGQADLIGMGRALLADPELPNKAREGRTDEIVPCLACGECLAQTMSVAYGGAMAEVGRALCSVNPQSGKEAALAPAARKKRIFVAGSGPAGLIAAKTAAARGHEVTVFEKSSEPGGRLVFAALPPFKEDIRQLVKSLYVLAQKDGVTFRLNTELTPRAVEEARPDALILATGAEPLVPPIAGIDGPTVVSAEDVLSGCKRLQGAVVVIGGGMVGCETAEFLVEQGLSDITILEMLSRMAANVASTYRPFFLARLKKAGVRMETGSTVVEVTDRGVTAKRSDGSSAFIPAESVVLAAGYRADARKIEAFQNLSPEIHPIGDCVKARLIKDALEEGFAVGQSI